MVDMRNVIIMDESFLDLLDGDDARVGSVDRPESIPQSLKVDIVVHGVVNNKLQCLQLYLLGCPKLLDFLDDGLLYLNGLIVLL